MTWHEDTARIDADIIELSDDRLLLRLHLTDGPRDETYARVATPVVCPDLRPTPAP